jgi:hypothetical protein
MAIELWWDISPDESLECAKSFLSALGVLGVVGVRVMVNKARKRSPDRSPLWKWSPAQFAKWSGECQGAGIECAPTLWVWPDSLTWGHQMRWLHDAHDKCRGLGSVELDAEDDWAMRFLSGWQSMTDAGVAVAEDLRGKIAGAKIELTSYPYHSEISPHASLSDLCDVIAPQAYSRFVGDDTNYRWGGAFGPGKMQTLAARRVISAGHQPSVCGLAAYGQQFPGRKIAEAIAVAADSALANGFFRMRYWSAKWIVGGRRQDETVSALSRYHPPWKTRSRPAPGSPLGELALGR